MTTFMRRRGLRVAAAIASLSLLGACAGAETMSEAAPRSAGTEVSIKGLAYLPADLTVGVGDTVTWVNADPVDHTITSGKPGKQGVPGVSEGTDPKLDGLFDEPVKTEGSTFSFTFDERGTFVYFCRVHAAMKGVITVE